ncbi:MAG: phosphoenolpyruvate carboxylase, partial [Pseudomonadota bacterium]
MNVTTDKPFDVAKLQDNIRQFGELLGEVIKEQE